MWYNPSQTYRNPPSLSKAYAYYEHITLPRYFSGENETTVLRRAEPGESTAKTELFPSVPPDSSLMEWGIGVDLYFSTLRIMAVVLLIGGLLHLPNALYYDSRRYNPGVKREDLSFLLWGTAVCTSTTWVACSADACPETKWESSLFEDRYRIAQDGTRLVLRNSCELDNYAAGFVNWVGLIFMVFAVALGSFYLRIRETRFDEDK